MLIDNIVQYSIILIALIMGVQAALPLISYIKFRIQETRRIVDADSYFCHIPKDSKYKGFGIVINKQLLIRDNRPLTFSSIEKAEKYKENNKINGTVVYQIWDAKTGIVNIGKVKVGTN